MKKTIIIGSLALLVIVMIIIPITTKDPHVNENELSDIVKRISNVDIKLSKKEELKKSFKFKVEDKKHQAYYYGIDNFIVTINKNEFGIKDLFNDELLERDTLIEYLDKEVTLDNIKKEVLRDGGSTIYYADNYTVITCNTIDGNNGIIFGIKDMKKTDKMCK